MKNKSAFALFSTVFALSLLWLHQSLEAGAIATLKECFQFGIAWLNWSGIGAIAAFITVTVVGFVLLENLPRSSRLIAALLLPLVSVYVAGR